MAGSRPTSLADDIYLTSFAYATNFREKKEIADMAYEKEVEELMEGCRRDFLKPDEAIYRVELERVSTPTRSGPSRCCICYRDFTAYGVVALLLEYHSYVGEVCLDCIAAGPLGTAEVVREQAKKAESSDESLRLEFCAQSLEETKDWPSIRVRGSESR